MIKSSVQSRLTSISLGSVESAPRSPWQNPYVERVIGSIRRECLGHLIPLNAGDLRRVLSEYVGYCSRSRTYLSLNGNAPEPREEETVGEVIATPVLGGLHHRYSRKAA